MVVAVMVLSIGVIAGYQSLSASQIALGQALPRLLAETVVSNRAAEVQILGATAAFPDQVPMGGYLWQLELDRTATEAGFVQVTIRARAQGQPGATLTTYAPPGPQ